MKEGFSSLLLHYLTEKYEKPEVDITFVDELNHTIDMTQNDNVDLSAIDIRDRGLTISVPLSKFKANKSFNDKALAIPETVSKLRVFRVLLFCFFCGN